MAKAHVTLTPEEWDSIIEEFACHHEMDDLPEPVKDFLHYVADAAFVQITMKYPTVRTVQDLNDLGVRDIVLEFDEVVASYIVNEVLDTKRFFSLHIQK